MTVQAIVGLLQPQLTVWSLATARRSASASAASQSLKFRQPPRFKSRQPSLRTFLSSNFLVSLYSSSETVYSTSRTKGSDAEETRVVLRQHGRPDARSPQWIEVRLTLESVAPMGLIARNQSRGSYRTRVQSWRLQTRRDRPCPRRALRCITHEPSKSLLYLWWNASPASVHGAAPRGFRWRPSWSSRRRRKERSVC